MTSSVPTPTCRFCGAPLSVTVVDLGMSPLCESFLPADQINQMEPFFPLHVYVCEKCYLVQLEEYVSPEHIFTEYAYFSSYSTAWLKHASDYTDLMTERFGLNKDSFVVELASNDHHAVVRLIELLVELAKVIDRDPFYIGAVANGRFAIIVPLVCNCHHALVEHTSRAVLA